MEPQTECEGTTNDTIQNTLQQGSEQQGSEQPTHKEPTNLEQKPDRAAGKSSQYFTLLDLRRLTFTLDGEHVLNAQDATNEEFGTLADVVSDVTNVEQWYLEERRDFINALYAFCEERDYPFPFTIVDEQKTSTAPLTTEEEQNNALTS